MLSRRYSNISPVEIIKSKFGTTKYRDEYILDTFKKSYQTISSPIIYCILKPGPHKYKIKFFPPREKYFFCSNPNLLIAFIDNLLIEYNEIIRRDLTLFEKLVLFKTSLEQLINKYQEINQSILDIATSKQELSQKPHEENVPTPTIPLDSSLAYAPDAPEYYGVIFPQLGENSPDTKRIKTSHE